jgi:hypothetical protein
MMSDEILLPGMILSPDTTDYKQRSCNSASIAFANIPAVVGRQETLHDRPQKNSERVVLQKLAAYLVKFLELTDRRSKKP